MHENIAQKLQRQEDLSEREEEILDHTFIYDALLERQLVEDPRKWDEDEHAERFVGGIVNYAEPSNVLNDMRTLDSVSTLVPRLCVSKLLKMHSPLQKPRSC